MTLPFNPYLKLRPAAAAAVVNLPQQQQQQQQQKENKMGRQSQQRVNQTKRQFRNASSSKRKRKGDQLTLNGDRAFDAEQDCVVCHARSIARTFPTYRVPKRAHHELCANNTTTSGRGLLTKQNVANSVEEKRLKAHFSAPLNSNEKGSSRHVSNEAKQTFFAPRKSTPKAVTQGAVVKATTIDFGKSVANTVADAAFCEKHKNKSAPLAMIAFANEVVDKVMRPKNEDVDVFGSYFDGLTVTVPESEFAHENPHYHAIVGQKLLLVDWIKTCGISVPCPDAGCSGELQNQRTNFSKNKTLFPIFGLDGAPSWCMVMKMGCTCCHREFNSNEASVLLTLPEHIAQLYPVETKYALSNYSSHLQRDATDILDSIMLTYANGELCSRLLYSAMNRAYIRKITAYYSYKRTHKTNEPVTSYVAKDGVFLKQYPPLGDTIRDMCNSASSTKNNPWQVSDHDRHTREIQSAQCVGGMFAQDHTFEVIKNYQKTSLGAKAVWDVATSTGEIATAVCVPTTKTRHFSHAAKMLLQRPGFTPTVMYSDTWPHKRDYWENLNIQGRLGLFHYEKRILSTLRKKHVDFHDAVADLLDSLYQFESKDYEKVLSALKTGTLSPVGKQYTIVEIAQLQQSKYFRKRYKKYLRKQLREPNTMIQRLDDWFCKYKVTSSDPDSRPAKGRLDPCHNIPLFTPETKPAVENCKEKAVHLADPMDINQMYDIIPPNPNSKHQLTEYISKRGESKLEAFHDRLANFANSGMRNSLSDNLHLAGTARYNLAIRHKRRLLTLENPSERSCIPAAWEKIVPFWNHSELTHINQMATEVGAELPFPKAEPLPGDNGERFFSEYITTVNPMAGRYGEIFDDCVCGICASFDKEKLGEASTPAKATYLNKTTVGPTISDRKTHKPTPVHQPVIVAPPQQRPQLIVNQQQQQAWHTMMPILPMPMFFMPPPVIACCAKYFNWMQTRRGRPPHDRHCHVRGATKNNYAVNTTSREITGWQSNNPGKK